MLAAKVSDLKLQSGDFADGQAANWFAGMRFVLAGQPRPTVATRLVTVAAGKLPPTDTHLLRRKPW